MISAFPYLFDFSFFAITLLRVVFAVWFLLWSYKLLFTETSLITPPWLKKVIAGVSLMVGILCFIGLFTQIALLLGIFILLLKWYFDVKTGTLTETVFLLGFYVALIGFALLFLGPGAFAFDLPL